MAKNTQLRCQLITPDAEVLDVEAISVVFPAHDGQVGILKNRAPLLCQLGRGVCRVMTSDGQREFRIQGGFARMLDNRLTILTQHAENTQPDA
ncbi:MAG: F0F1 ATP synthase subunit epsilon [Planctomycetes bacterium]|nr:F0F1 ATP synthase subunit epsilon [Planctomycetota bacterium]